MNPLLRIGPYVYAALHSYNSVWELSLTRSERRTAERDAERMRARFPFLTDYEGRADAVRRKLSADHRTYTRAVSPDPIAISLELAVFLGVVCDATTPRAILDLGSGFSSYVFRAYAKSTNTEPAPVVHSVDHSREWLAETRRFLEPRGVDCRHLETFDDFVAADKPRFDLVLVDIADLGTRVRMIDLVLESCRPGGMIVIDDMHVPGYRRSVLGELRKRRLEHFSLRSFTRKRLRYSYLIVP
jgi:predicted O-methyltransferase YrrM